MRLLFVEKDRYLGTYWGEMIRALDCELVDSDPDVILGFSVATMEAFFAACKAWPKARKVQYAWDVYDWVWKRPRQGEYEYHRYVASIRFSDLFIAPSRAAGEQVRRLTATPFKVVLSGAPLFDHAKIRDDDFVLNPLRVLPDEQDGWIERACAELSIPCKSPNHELPVEAYHDLVASCSLVASTYAELSTGGLTCLEAYRLGKPILGCLGDRNGLHEYLAGRQTYFCEGEYEDLKHQLSAVWNDRRVELDHRQYVDAHFSMTAMARRLDEALRT